MQTDSKFVENGIMHSCLFYVCFCVFCSILLDGSLGAGTPALRPDRGLFGPLHCPNGTEGYVSTDLLCIQSSEFSVHDL